MMNTAITAAIRASSIAAVLVLGLGNASIAAERTKPHANVGTIGIEDPTAPQRRILAIKKLKKIDTSDTPIVVCPNPQDAYPGC